MRKIFYEINDLKKNKKNTFLYVKKMKKILKKSILIINGKKKYS